MIHSLYRLVELRLIDGMDTHFSVMKFELNIDAQAFATQQKRVR